MTDQRVRGAADYSPILVDRSDPPPAWETEAQAAVHTLLMDCAETFAHRCCAQPSGKFLRDDGRRPSLRYGRGLGADESAAFLRALDSGLATVESDGAFFVPAARACSPNLHLVGRNEDHVAVHTEVLIHVGAFAELVLDQGWKPERLVFDPFTRGAALDLWGFDAASDSNRWWEGRITFVCEAKARVSGSDSLTSLAAAFDRLALDASTAVEPGHQRKWAELVSIVSDHGPVELLLAADGARWWYDVARSGVGVRVNRRG